MNFKLRESLDFKFWKKFSAIFTDSENENDFSFFYDLQDEFSVIGDEVDDYCKEMKNWNREKQEDFITKCLIDASEVMKYRITKFLEKYR